VTVSLAAEAAAVLRRRAAAAELGAAPPPAAVLFNFCVARCDLRGAAAAQLAWARRLRAEAPGSAAALAQTADALGARPPRPRALRPFSA
jgi:hypothetical protein